MPVFAAAPRINVVCSNQDPGDGKQALLCDDPSLQNSRTPWICFGREKLARKLFGKFVGYLEIPLGNLLRFNLTFRVKKHLLMAKQATKLESSRSVLLQLMCCSHLVLVLTDRRNGENMENEEWIKVQINQSFHPAQICSRIGIKGLETWKQAVKNVMGTVSVVHLQVWAWMLFILVNDF